MAKLDALPRRARLRRIVMVAAVAPVIFAVAPRTAAAGPLVGCDQPSEGTTVLEENDSVTVTPSAPLLGDAVQVPFLLDLYPAEAKNKASMGATLDWMAPFNDWDVVLRDSQGKVLKTSNRSQISGQSPGEAITHTLKHCNLFTIEIVNARGIPLDLIDPLELTLTTGSVT
jgi:hypothetical protein